MSKLKRVLSLMLTAIMLMGMMVTSNAAADSFSDAEEITYKEEVAITAGLGLFAGADGKFMPQDTVTRAQMATIIVKMLHGADANADGFKGVSGGFTDTAGFEGGWAEGYINWCASLGIVKGYGDGTFKPGNKVTAAEAVTMILNALKIDAGEGTWPVTVMAKAEEVKFFADLKTKPASDKALSREELAVVSLAGLMHNPDGKQGFKYDGKLYDSYMDAYMVAGKDNATFIEPYQGDSLAGKVFELLPTEGYIVGNQDTGLDCTRLHDGKEFDIVTTLDQIGHYVTVYYKELFVSEFQPGVTYAVIDECLVVEVDEVIDGTKDYKNAFGKNYSDSANILHIDGSYTIGHTGVIADEYKTRENGGSSYVAGSAAPTGTYVIHEGNIVSYMEPAMEYAGKVTRISEYGGEQYIILSDGSELPNHEGGDEVVEYEGITAGDYVTYSVAQGVYVLKPVETFAGTVTAIAPNDRGETVLRVSGMEFIMFTGENGTDLSHNTSDIDFNIIYKFYVSGDGEVIGFEPMDDDTAASDVCYLLGAYATKAKDSYGKEIVYTNAQGVDINGKEVQILLGVKEPGEDQLGVAADQISQVREGFYTVTDPSDPDARKAGIKVLDDCGAVYDEEENPLFIGTIPGSTASYTREWKTSTVYHTLHICTAECKDIVLAEGSSGDHITTSTAIGYYSDHTRWVTVDGVLGQPLETSATPRSSVSYIIASEMGYKFPILFSKDEDGNYQVEMIVMKVEKDALAGGGSTPIYVADTSLTPAGTSADGYVYEVYDGHTGELKQIVMEEESLSVTPGFYRYTEDDGIVTLGRELNNNDDEELLYFTNHLFESLYNETRINTINPYSTMNSLRADSISSAKVVDLRTEEEKNTAKEDTILSVSRIAALKKSGRVVELSAYSSSNTVKVIFITDILVGPDEGTSEVVYMPAAPAVDSVSTVIDANGVEKRVFINEASQASGFVTLVNDGGVIKVTAGAGSNTLSDQKLQAVDSAAKTVTFGGSSYDAANVKIADLTDNGIDTLAELKSANDEFTVTVAARISGDAVPLLIVCRLDSVNENCPTHAQGTVLTGSESTLASGTYYLKQNVAASSNITISGDVTLCLSGYTLTAPSTTGNFITVNNGGKLTVCGGHDGSGCISGGSATNLRGLYIGTSDSSTEGTVVLESGTISGFKLSGNGAGAYVDKKGMLTMNGGAISGNTGVRGGGVYVRNGATFTMNNGTIGQNEATDYAGGVYIGSSTTSLNGGTICDNKSVNTGGGIRMGDSCKPVMDGVTITGNKAGSANNGMYVGSGTFTIKSGVVNGSIDKASAAKISITGGTFSSDPSSYVAQGYEVVKSGALWVVQEKVLYTVTAGSVSNGTVEVSKNSGYTGDTVIVTATPAQGYELKEILVDSNPISGTSFTITGDHIVTATFTETTTEPAPGNANCSTHTVGVALTAAKLTELSNTLSAGTYYLSESFTAASNITVSGNVTLCLSGYTLTAPSTATVAFITVANGAKLTICGGHEGSGCISGGSATNLRGLKIGDSTQNTAGTAVLESGTISGFNYTGNGAGVYASSYSTFIMNGGTISGNTATGNGGGVYVQKNNTFTMNDGTISGNTATGYAGGIYIGSSNTSLNGGTISGNTAGTDGGGIRSGDSCTFTMDGVTIRDNTAGGNGGGVYVRNGTFKLKSGTITGNTDKTGGNAVYGYGGTTAISGGTVSGTVAKGSGTITVTGGTFSEDPSDYVAEGHTASQSGGKWVVE